MLLLLLFDWEEFSFVVDIAVAAAINAAVTAYASCSFYRESHYVLESQ